MGLWRGKSPLILASQSSARKMLLANAGIEFQAVTADIDERRIQAASKLSTPRAIASLLAREKARAVSARHPGSYVIGADQTLALGQELFTGNTTNKAPAFIRIESIDAKDGDGTGAGAAQVLATFTTSVGPLQALDFLIL